MALQVLDCEGPVWQVRPCAQSGLLAVELRLAEPMETRFLAWAPGSAAVRLLCEAPDWWTGLAAVGHGCILLHRFEDPAMPVRQGVWAYSASTGSLVWAQPQAQFVGISAQGFVLQLPEGTTHLDPKGKPLPAVDSDSLMWPQQQFPGIALHTDDWWSALCERLQPHLDFVPTLQLEYLRVGDTEVWVALDAQQGAHLLVLHANALVHRALLMPEQTQIGLDSFFVWQGQLVYVQGRQQLCVWALP